MIKQYLLSLYNFLLYEILALEKQPHLYAKPAEDEPQPEEEESAHGHNNFLLIAILLLLVILLLILRQL